MEENGHIDPAENQRVEFGRRVRQFVVERSVFAPALRDGKSATEGSRKRRGGFAVRRENERVEVEVREKGKVVDEGDESTGCDRAVAQA